MESASQKRPRTDTGEEEEAEVKSEQTDEDDDEDRVAFLEVRPLAHLPCTNRILTEHHLGANSHATKSACSGEGQEVTDECQTRGFTHTHPRGLYKRSDRPYLRDLAFKATYERHFSLSEYVRVLTVIEILHRFTKLEAIELVSSLVHYVYGTLR